MVSIYLFHFTTICLIYIYIWCESDSRLLNLYFNVLLVLQLNWISLHLSRKDFIFPHCMLVQPNLIRLLLILLFPAPLSATLSLPAVFSLIPPPPPPPPPPTPPPPPPPPRHAWLQDSVLHQCVCLLSWPCPASPRAVLGLRWCSPYFCTALSTTVVLFSSLPLSSEESVSWGKMGIQCPSSQGSSCKLSDC